MNFDDIFKRYVFSDGDILFFRLDYDSKHVFVTLQVRKLLSKQKFSPCHLDLEFRDVSEIYFFEDFPTDGGFTDVTFVKLDTKGFYLSLDPYGNAGVPHEEDNLIVKAGGLTLIDENGIRHDIV